MGVCLERTIRDSMTDEEFWGHVLGTRAEEHDVEPDEEDYPEMIVGFCLRCGGNLIAEDYQQLRQIIDEDREICDDCADDMLPDLDDDMVA